jgi:hypothetical protein
MTPLPWSHSSIAGFETCGRQYEEIKVLHNFQDQKNPASIWGDEVHKVFEKYIAAGVAERERLGIDWTMEQIEANITHVLPVNMVQYREYLATFIARPGKTLVEQQYALDKRLQPCEFYDKKNCWGRGIIDVLTLLGNVALVDDHKTGKNRKKDMQQLIIFALLTFYHHPEIDTCQCTFHWLQLGAQDSEEFTRDMIPKMWETLVPKLDRYMRAFHLGIFHPKPSGLCKNHCAVQTCEHWGSGRR